MLTCTFTDRRTDEITNGENLNREWQNCDDIVKSNAFMLDNQYACDVHFIVGNEGVHQGAHKFVLVSRSPVFDAMFCGPMRATDQEGSTVVIPDIEPQPFTAFLRYLYCGEAGITPDNVIYLLYAAQKYSVLGLATKCISFVDQVLDTDNACTVLEQAHIFNEKDFYSSVLALILRKAEEVLSADDVTYLCDDCLATIVGSSNLMAREAVILNACLRWAEAECKRQSLDVSDCNRRLVLNKILYKIRFPLLPVEIFMEKVVPGSLLTEEEKVDVMGRFIMETRPSTFFNTELRIVQRQLKLNRFQALFGTGFNNRSGSNAIAFKVGQDIILEGFTIYGSCRPSELELEVKGQVLDPNDVVLCSVERNLYTQGDKGLYDIIFDESATLEKNVLYTLEVNIAGAHTFAGKDGRLTTFSHNVAFTFSHSEKSQTGTTVSHGQLPGLIFALRR
ncbi:BTB/POZ domain-containing protein [Elysia marginata]|uniref:BTB/POZ domain-containing protein n=1 Tax=Elysia marginata TaxID=1093978 RepID=A0AAV4GZZ1_9GAST|nr:BTB/POZ domain-containing protein [Elysia marginata]